MHFQTPMNKLFMKIVLKTKTDKNKHCLKRFDKKHEKTSHKDNKTLHRLQRQYVDIVSSRKITKKLKLNATGPSFNKVQ